MGKTVKDQLGRVVETSAIKAPAVILVTPQLGVPLYAQLWAHGFASCSSARRLA